MVEIAPFFPPDRLFFTLTSNAYAARGKKNKFFQLPKKKKVIFKVDSGLFLNRLKFSTFIFSHIQTCVANPLTKGPLLETATRTTLCRNGARHAILGLFQVNWAAKKKSRGFRKKQKTFRKISGIHRCFYFGSFQESFFWRN